MRQTNAILGAVNRMDEIGARALASNTTLEKMNIPNLGISLSKLGGEILDLREEGFKNLDISTLQLIKTMKLTNQGTQSLKNFLANTSLTLRLNSFQIQELGKRLSETGIAYGVSQEKMFEVASKLEKALSVANIYGKGGQVTEAVSEIAAQLGVRVTDDLANVVEFLTTVGNESQLMMAGLFDIGNQFLGASKEGMSEMIIRATKIFTSKIDQVAATAGTGKMGQRQLQQVIDMMGGQGVAKSFQAIATSMQDVASRTSDNNQALVTIKSLDERKTEALETAAAKLTEVVNKLPGGLAGAAGTAMGAVQAVGGTIGSLYLIKKYGGKLLGRTAAAGAAGLAGGPAGLIAAGIFTVGSTLWLIKDIMAEVSDTSKATKQNTEETAKRLDPNKGENIISKQSMGLIDVLNTMVARLGPTVDATSAEALQVQKQMSERLALINDKIGLFPMVQPQQMLTQR